MCVCVLVYVRLCVNLYACVCVCVCSYGQMPIYNFNTSPYNKVEQVNIVMAERVFNSDSLNCLAHILLNTSLDVSRVCNTDINTNTTRDTPQLIQLSLKYDIE